MLPALFGGIAVGLLLGLLGSGGSVATVPILVYLVGVPEKAAIASSLAIVGTVALSGAVRSPIEKRAVLLFCLPGMVGSYIGATLSGGMAASTQMTLFAAVLGIAAVSMLMRRDDGNDEGARGPAWQLLAAGLATGVLTGIVGVGGGFLIVPALVLFAGLPTRRAIGTSLRSSRCSPSPDSRSTRRYSASTRSTSGSSGCSRRSVSPAQSAAPRCRSAFLRPPSAAPSACSCC